MATAEAMAVSEPATSAAHIGSEVAADRDAVAPERDGSATVAGPSRKCTNCAPSK